MGGGLRRLGLSGLFAVAVLALSSTAGVAGGSDWKVGYITGSGATLSFASADMPSSGLADFNFTNQPNTSFLVTTHGASKGTLLGDDRNKTISATFHIDGAGPFFYDTTNNPCGTPANVRLYFQTDGGGGFAFTHFWWSNPESVTLANGSFTLTANVEPGEWSDWNGQPGLTQIPGFEDAASNVTMIGFSFGGGCFFSNGVGTVDGTGTFTLDSFSVG